MTTRLSSFVSKSRWDSDCFVVPVNVSLVRVLFVKSTRMCVLDHVTTRFSSFVAKSRWDSVCFVGPVNVSLVRVLFVKSTRMIKSTQAETDIKFFGEIGEKYH
jgi:hypothetical protein